MIENKTKRDDVCVVVMMEEQADGCIVRGVCWGRVVGVKKWKKVYGILLISM